MKQYAPALFAASAFLLSACGGGGSTGNPVPTGGSGPTPTPTPTATPSTTVAQGTLVDDPSNTPLSGVTVRVDPWIAYATPGPTPTPIAVSTTDPSGHFIVNEPNGTYLLVIGPDAVNTPPPGWSTPAPNATDTPIPGATGWRPTIHDRIVLTGGGTVSSPLTLHAPTLVPQPLYTPPAVETSGAYRLATIDALNEAPCYLYFNQQREANSRSDVVLDEWSIENSRAVVFVGTQSNGAGQIVFTLTTGSWVSSGGANCAAIVQSFAFTNASKQWSLDRQTLWFGADYVPYTAQYSGRGAGDFPIDPRILPDPSGTPWP